MDAKGSTSTVIAAALRCREAPHLNMLPRIRPRRQGSAQASAEHFQKCADPLRNRGLGLRHDCEDSPARDWLRARLQSSSDAATGFDAARIQQALWAALAHA